MDKGDNSGGAHGKYEGVKAIPKLSPEICRMLGDATLCYAHGKYEEAIAILREILKRAPHVPDAYHRLGLVHDTLGNEIKAFYSYTIAAILARKASVLWEFFFGWFSKHRFSGRAIYLLSRVISADPQNMEKAEFLFSALEQNGTDTADLIAKVADSLMHRGHYSSALKCYTMLKGNPGFSRGFIHEKMARCHLSLNDRVHAILCFYEALKIHEGNIEARLTLASLLLEESREDEAILLLSPPTSPDCTDPQTDNSEPWWCNGKVKVKLSHIYKAKGMRKEFVDAIYPLVHESLCFKPLQQRVNVKRRLTKSVLLERVKVLHDQQDDNLSRPVAPASDLLRAALAKKLLRKKAKVEEGKRAEAMVAGVDWDSDDSDDDPAKEIHKGPPLPDLLKDKEHHDLLIYLCKSLASLQRYCEALEIINLALVAARNNSNMSSVAEELRSFGAQIAHNTPDPEHGVDCVKYLADELSEL